MFVDRLNLHYELENRYVESSFLTQSSKRQIICKVVRWSNRIDFGRSRSIARFAHRLNSVFILLFYSQQFTFCEILVALSNRCVVGDGLSDRIVQFASFALMFDERRVTSKHVPNYFQRFIFSFFSK